MGKVFTPEEIADGQFPEPGAHLEAAQYIVDQLFVENASDDSSDPAIAAGLIHGSTSHGTANRRSDVGVLIVHDLSSKALDTVHDVFSEAAAAYRVPIEPTVISIDDAEDGCHTVNPLFLAYLLDAEGSSDFNWNSPASLLDKHIPVPNQLALTQDTRAYVDSQSEGYAEALESDEALDAHRVQGALELPVDLGRSVLTMLDQSFPAFMATDSQILKGLELFMASHRSLKGSDREETLRRLDYLLYADRMYSTVLEDAIAGKMTLESYQSWIDKHKRVWVRAAMKACTDIGQSINAYMEKMEAATD